MKKKKGFTLLELIIAMTLTLIILSITFSLFINITKDNTDIKYTSTLQTEAQNISRHIETTGMEAAGIKKMILDDGTPIYIGDPANPEKAYKNFTLVNSDGKVDDHEDNNQWISIKEIQINNKYDDGTDEIKINKDNPFTISFNDSKITMKKPKYKDGNIPDGVMIIPDNPGAGISSNVTNMLIKPSNLIKVVKVGEKVQIIKQGDEKLSDAASIEIKVNLEKKKGSSDVKYSAPVTVTFRNKTTGN